MSDSNYNITPSLANKRVLLGISAGIAAYKTPDLVRKLTELGAEVRCILTRNAEQFVAPLALQAVSGHPVHDHAMSAESESGMGHIDLARWADVVLIAPATANLIARLNQGMADELLTTVCVATNAPIQLAPAMNQQMWQNAATQANLAQLQQRGLILHGPASGDQACGEVGPGRMLQPEELAAAVAASFTTGALAGVQLMLTAGPTWEPLDPVRGLTNHSSGLMGYALAQAALEAGATVTLVSGPTNLTAPEGARVVNVTTAEQMMAAVQNDIAEQQIFIGVAAVADYRPKTSIDNKIKKDSEEMQLTLVRNPDILATVAGREHPPFCVGFAAETDDVVAYARAKLERKKLDLIAANHVGGDQTGFGTPDNAITLISHDGEQELPQQNKYALARQLIKVIAEHYAASAKK
ncbi:MAG: bifunctional phosphopantothenoylcysteine decarboxylase/phosphopantothenate--cysteine ligase CoaBC [Gammaproteobacteria bacterium]|nr:bifunctional phosphopantothenoylcysteine decarboxylase/phosphopantothenate--cysteine ligase CoaBC [Gammaproteobacteria bacterium]